MVPLETLPSVEGSQQGGGSGHLGGRGGRAADGDVLVVGPRVGVGVCGGRQNVDAGCRQEGLRTVVAVRGEPIGPVGRGDAHHAAIAGGVAGIVVPSLPFAATRTASFAHA